MFTIVIQGFPTATAVRHFLQQQGLASPDLPILFSGTTVYLTIPEEPHVET